MTTEQIKEALELTPENEKELTEMFSDKITPNIITIYLQAIEYYDHEKGADAFKKLTPWDKISFTFWYGLMQGYEAALADVRTVQQESLQAG